LTIDLLLFLGLITILLLTVQNVYAGGPRHDSPEETIREGGNCYVDGYDAGVANAGNTKETCERFIDA